MVIVYEQPHYFSVCCLLSFNFEIVGRVLKNVGVGRILKIWWDGVWGRVEPD